MIALLDNGQDLDQCASEIGSDVGQLLTPLTRYKLRNLDKPWAIDNGVFSNFDEAKFWSLLKREEHHQTKCLFLTVPDVVGSAIRTLEVFERWKDRLKGWKLALACQDGQEHLPIPWDDIAAIFIGGSSSFKDSQSAVQIIKAGKLLGKHVHVGRVNSVLRWNHFEKLGVDTIDGTGLSRYSHMRGNIKKESTKPRFFPEQ